MKNRHGVCRGTYLALSLSLIVGVTVHAKTGSASDAPKPLDQPARASAPRFNPQAIFDLLGLKQIDYPNPGEQDPQEESASPNRDQDQPNDDSTIDYQGKTAQAVLSIVSFQLPSNRLDDDHESEAPSGDHRFERSMDSVGVPSSDQPQHDEPLDNPSLAVEQLSLSPPATSDDTHLEQADLPTEHDSSEALRNDGSFELTVSTENRSDEVMQEGTESETVDDATRSFDVADFGTADFGTADFGTDDIGYDAAARQVDADDHQAVDETRKSGSIDPWDDPRLFEPADEPLVANDKTPSPAISHNAEVNQLTSNARRPRSARQPDREITPIEASKPMGPPPVADKVVSHQAQMMIEDGIRLARRGALYSARARFIRALRLITQAYDAQAGTRYYSESLARGFRALEEVNDFRPKGSRLEADLDLQRIVQSHRTPVLHSSDLRRLTVLVAQQAYHTYAENQLIDAAGHDPAAADALFALGKVQGHLSAQRGDASTAGDAEAMSLYQTALAIHPNHHHAANELGVLFARYGQLEDARALLRHCVRDRTNFPEVWRNLAQVHEQLGEVELAKRANNEWQSAVRHPGQSAKLAAKPSVQWVDPTTFANLSGPDTRAMQQDIARTQEHAKRAAPPISRTTQRPDLPSTNDQPLSVGQRYGR